MANLHFKHARQAGGNATARLRHAQNCYLLASGHIENSKWDEARDLLLRALAYHPEHVDALRALANLEFTTGDIPQARVYLDRLLVLPGPIDAETFFVQGNIELSEGNLIDALTSYCRSEEMEGSTPELEFNKGLAHLMLGHGEEAVAIFTRLVEEQPANARAWDALGCSLRLDKHYDEASTAFLQALQVDPGQNDTRDHMAQMLLERGDPRRARLVLEAALAIDPERASSRHLLGLSDATAQDFPSAIACWEDLIARGGALPETHHLLANAYLRLNDRPRAITALQTLITLAPGHLPGHLQLALLLLEQGEFDRGWRHLEQARAIDPQNPAVTQLVSVANAMHPQRDRSDM
ncbi:MAG: tetratricopeptide repeat protein [Armatimonadota bacterium]